MTIHAPSIITFDAEDTLRCEIAIAVSAPMAFERFRHDIFHWWPREFTWSGTALEDLFLEGRKGGMLWERGPDGLRLDWARVMRWLPPEKFVLRWHIGPGRVPQPDVANASEVEIQFRAEGPRATCLALEHRSFACHGAGASEYQSMMASQHGWPLILERFARHCAK